MRACALCMLSIGIGEHGLECLSSYMIRDTKCQQSEWAAPREGVRGGVPPPCRPSFNNLSI